MFRKQQKPEKRETPFDTLFTQQEQKIDKMNSKIVDLKART